MNGQPVDNTQLIIVSCTFNPLALTNQHAITVLISDQPFWTAGDTDAPTDPEQLLTQNKAKSVVAQANWVAQPAMSLSGVFSFAPRVAARRARLLAPFSLALALLGGCKINAVATPTGCVKDIDCPGGASCTNGTCLPHAAGGTWAIELLPTSDSSAAQTQLAAVGFSNEKTNILTADAKATITGDLPEGEALIGHSHVILTIQTPIPGHADLQFQTDWLTLDVGAARRFRSRFPRAPWAAT